LYHAVVPWQPLLTGDLATRARDAIDAIVADLPRFPVARPDLPGGHAGTALFHAYRAKAGAAGADEAAGAALDRAMDGVAEQVLPPWLHGGFAGVAWVIEHLWRTGEGDDDANEEIDAALLGHLAEGGPAAYDLIAGLAGLAVYALERGPRGEALLAAIVDELARRAIPADVGVTLLTPPEELFAETRAQYPDGYFNLGVAHGVPAVIGLLAAAPGERARTLRAGLTAWVRSTRHPAPDGSLYPYTIDKRNPRPNAGCRAAWCYGDPGIAAALLRGARAAGDAELEALALEAGRAAAARAPDRAGVIDAGLCHGAAGLLHVFNRLWQGTGDEEFRAAAIRWAEATLAMRGEGVGGYRSYNPTIAAKWEDDPGMLTGATGVGLALLAATTDVEPRWDTVLVCDVPVR
jgi:lantibiotic modifying enzyme